MKAKVEALADAMRQLPQLAIDLGHHSINGMYARSGFIPAGAVIAGCTHKTDHISILVGDATLTLNDSIERISGYNVLPTKAGMTRAIYANSDCWMVTICRTEKKELADIEDDLVHNAETLQTHQPQLKINVTLIGA